MQPLNTQRDFVNSYYYVKLVTDEVSWEKFVQLYTYDSVVLLRVVSFVTEQ